MKTISAIRTALILPLFLCLISACAQAQTKKARQVASFKGIQASSALKIFLKQGNEQSVVVETDDALQSKIITEVNGGILKIYRDGKWGDWNNKDVVISITCKQLQSVDISGATAVKGETSFNTPSLALEASGASKIELDVVTDKLDVEAKGASKVTLTGKADQQKVEVSGASHYKAFELKSKNVNIHASGASGAEVVAEEEINADASGASGIKYKGSPKKADVQSSGASSIKKLS